ncbi:hypothetical protein D0S45_15740 [Marinifilum sp. JC120]|nr:hypothetical protein D0S45_15740 [Marinifilum sp. JC120]
MLKTIFKTITPIIAILLVASMVHAHQKRQQVIKIVCGYKFPPFYTVTSKKEPSKNLSGTFIDLMHRFQENYPQYKIEYKCMPRARIGKQLTRGKADAFALTSPMFLPPEVKNKYTSSMPMWTISDHLLVLKDSPIKQVDFDNMTGATIAVLHGNDHGPLNQYFEKGLLKRHPVYATRQILDLVSKKRVDAAICNKMTLPGLIKDTQHTMEHFKILEEPLYSFRLHLIIHRKYADFLSDFNEFTKKSPLTEIQ